MAKRKETKKRSKLERSIISVSKKMSVWANESGCSTKTMEWNYALLVHLLKDRWIG